MKTKNTRRSALLCLAFFGAGLSGLYCESASAEGIKTETTIGLTMTTKTELAAKISETISVPFLVGSGPLTSDNNVKFKLDGEASPVSLNAAFETVWTPIAFLEIVGGASAGSGWNIPMANGLRHNEREGAHDAELTGGPFNGLVWSVKGGAALQGDLAAFKPGDWNHLIFRTYHAFQYRALTSADSEESWLYRADDGENRNGWNYYGNYFLGYRMPIKLNMIGLLVEEDLYLYDVDGGDTWGDDISRWTFGLLANYAFTDRFSAMLMAQARTVRNFTDATDDYEFYQDRVVDTDDERRIEFYRLVATLTYRLK